MNGDGEGARGSAEWTPEQRARFEKEILGPEKAQLAEYQKKAGKVVPFVRGATRERIAARMARSLPARQMEEEKRLKEKAEKAGEGEGRNAWTAEERLEREERLQASKDGRTQLVFDGNQLEETVIRAEWILLTKGAGIYQRGNDLVRLVVEDVPASKGRKVKVAHLVQIAHSYLLSTATKFIDWRKGDGNKASPHDRVVSAMLKRFGRWEFPRVAGVLMTPTLRADGSVLDQEGYDPVTELILVQPPKMQPVPEAPTRDEALTAIKVLDELLDEFPFEDGPSRSVALSALITPVARGACVAVPMHAVTAPTAGTGKTFLWSIAGAIATGELEMPAIAAGGNADEFEKRLNGALIMGLGVFSIDNVTIPLRGDALCQAITADIYLARILGRSEVKRLRNVWSLYANGNNLRLVDDVVRRALLVRLDAKVERPELLKRQRDPIEMVLKDRGRYIAAILTVLRAYIAAGSPNKAPGIGSSFAGWSDLVRSALIWLGYEDPYLTVEAARAGDPELQKKQAVFLSLKEAFGTEPTGGRTCAEMIEVLNNGFVRPVGAPPLPMLEQKGRPDPTVKQLQEALMLIAVNPKELTANKLGYWFRANKGKVVTGLVLKGEADRTGSMRWWVEKAPEK